MAPHRYWRVYITESNSGSDNFIRGYEAEFRGSVGGADQCSGGTASASHNNSTAYKLFNNNGASDYWLSGGPSAPCWFQYDFGAGNAVDVAEWGFTPGNSSQTPKAFSLQWSDDGSSFTTLSSWSNVTDWIGGAQKLFAIAAPASITTQWDCPYALTLPVSQQWDEGWDVVQKSQADRQWSLEYSQTVDRQWELPWRRWVEQAWECPISYSPYEPKSQFAVFPSLPGLSWELKKTPEFRTSIQTASSGREQRGAFRAYPVWRFSLLFDWLRAGNPRYEYETLQGFILGRRGSFESFLFLDPTDSVCTDMPFGVGDGEQTAFQLTRAFGFHGSFSFVEPVENIKTLTAIRMNGTTLSAPNDYAISSTGLVTFTVPPAVGAVLTWSGTFYFRCRFGEDTADFARTLPNLWELRELTFIGATGNKI